MWNPGLDPTAPWWIATLRTEAVPAHCLLAESSMPHVGKKCPLLSPGCLVWKENVPPLEDTSQNATTFLLISQWPELSQKATHNC